MCVVDPCFDGNSVDFFFSKLVLKRDLCESNVIPGRLSPPNRGSLADPVVGQGGGSGSNGIGAEEVLLVRDVDVAA